MEKLNVLTPRWASARDELSSRRAARAARRKLEHELATFNTPAELAELDAILERTNADEAAEIRRIINRLRVA